MYKVFLILLLVGLMGCAIQHDVRKSTYVEGMVTVTVNRPWRLVSGGVEMYVHIDDDVVLSMPNGTSNVFYIKPGEYRIHVSDGVGSFGQSGRVEFIEGKTYRIVLIAAFSNGGSYEITEEKEE